MKVDIITPTALVDIQVSANFYERLQELLLWMISNQDPESVRATNEKIMKGTELDEWGEHYRTLLSLVNDIEEAAHVQCKVQQVDIGEPV